MKENNNDNDNNNTPRVSRSKDGPINVAATTTIAATRSDNNNRKKGRFAVAADEGGGDLMDCSGKYCKSCMAGLIADCVALCCCPCAVLHCFALAFVKAPWVVGRRCLGLGKNNKKNKKNKKLKRKCCKRGCEVDDDDVEVVDVDVVLERNRKRDLSVDTNVVGEMDSVTVNAAFEAEKVWLELYQIGHIDFGRVSSSQD
ncbi:hypothetical protein RIF29_18719 [Crotalaria pallida]|uniref:Uncharacterized protein n=1 Tax=Crotalaria pallida TaxID=3830 RepID=A0AAN9I5T2_CROPI